MAKGKSCLNCSKFLTCLDPSKLKVSGYSCVKFVRMGEHPSNAELIPSGYLDAATSLTTVDSVYGSLGGSDVIPDNFIEEAMKRAYDPDTNTVRDLRVDDSSLPLAKNFFDFCLNIVGKSIKMPFARQMWLSYQVLAEFCVEGDTLVQTNRGLLRIADLTGKGNPGMRPANFRTVTLDGNNRVSHAGMTSKSRKCLAIKSQGELDIVATPEHRVLVLNEELDTVWVEARNLQIGDYLVSKIGANLWPSKPATLETSWVFRRRDNNNAHEPTPSFKPQLRVTPELARLIGYLLTDGHITANGVGFSNEDRALLLDWIRCASAVFQLDFDLVARAIRKVYASDKPMTISFPTWTSEYLQSLGVSVGNCYDKDIPAFITGSDKDTVCNFIRAAFDSDGWVDRHGRNGRIGIQLTNTKIVRKIHLLMKNLA